MVERRINQLERRFRRDDSYFQYYKTLQLVAVMADIEAMFYQVNVAEKHRSFLQFLGWEGSGINKSIVDHETCVHIFGGVSSSSCNNYALKKQHQTTIKNLVMMLQ